MKTPLRLLAILACLSGSVAIAAENHPENSASRQLANPENSSLDGRTFYQLLLAEISVRQEDPGTGYSLLLDAARRTQAPELYSRAIEVAIRARAGDAALQAARSWQRAHPQSRQAAQYELEILIALNRLHESAPVLERVVDLSAPNQSLQTIESIPGLYSRASDRKEAATAVEAALRKQLESAPVSAAAWAVIARFRWLASDPQGALAALQLAQSANPDYEPTFLLAVELLSPERPLAEKAVQRFLLRPSAASPDFRLAYSRALLTQGRNLDALAQLQLITDQHPDRKDILLSKGGILLQLRRFAEARKAIEEFLASLPVERQTDSRQLQQRNIALSALSQIAEKMGRPQEAEQWLLKADPDGVSLTTQLRRAGILARGGQLEKARSIIQAVPVTGPAEEKARLLAEVQLLREVRQYKEAISLLEPASNTESADTDLLYELSLLTEKLGDFDRMESLLRRILAAQPNSAHAFNALGYSLAERNIRLSEAFELIRKAVELAPDDPYIQDSLGWVEFRRGNHQRAREILERAFQAKPDAEIAAHLGEVLWILGDFTLAKSTWQKGLDLNSDNETLIDTLRRFGNPIALESK